MKKHILLLATFVMSMALTPFTFASTVKGADNVRIDEPVTGNLYAAGGKVKIDATVSGDVMAAGGEIWINEEMLRDVTLAGGNIVIRGVTGEDLRLIGGHCSIMADVQGDLIITGGEIEVEDGITIGGDLIIAGGEVSFDGTVKGDVRVFGGEIDFNGLVEGDFISKGGDVEINGEIKGTASISAQELDLGDNSRFHGQVEYWTKNGKIDFNEYLVDGATASYNTDLKIEFEGLNGHTLKKAVVGFMVFRFLGAMVLIFLLISFFNRFFSENASRITKDYMTHLGYGTLVFIGLPIIGAIACATVIGIPAGLVMFSSFGIAVILSNALTAVVAAYGLEHYNNRHWNKGMILIVSIGIYTALKVVGFIPLLGNLAVFALTLMAFGFIINSLRNREKPTPPDTPEDLTSDMV